MLAYRADPPIAWATLSRPEKRNAMTRAFWGELRELLARAAADDAVRALVFSGEGPSFSVGGDIDGFADIGGPADRRAYLQDAIGALRAVETFPKPTVAAVHGHAVGGGCELTMVCDIVIADETARFGLPEVRVGLVPGLGVARGAAQLNLHWLKFLVLTGEALDAQEARLAGIVNRVTPPGEHLAAAEALARSIAAHAPLALEVGKDLLGRQVPDATGEAIDAVGMLMGTEDFGEGIAAFRERRPPRFEAR